MNRKNLILKVSKKLKDESSAVTYLNDLDKEEERKAKAKTEKLIKDIVNPYTTGIYRDNSWLPLHQITKELQKQEIEPTLINSEYYQNPNQSPKTSPDGKKWKFEILFRNKGGWLLTITAHFGPSKIDPKNQKEHLSDAYDLTFSLVWDKNI